MAESVTPQPRPGADVLHSILHNRWKYGKGVGDARLVSDVLDAFADAGFRLVPPRWDVVRLEREEFDDRTGYSISEYFRG